MDDYSTLGKKYRKYISLLVKEPMNDVYSHKMMKYQTLLQRSGKLGTYAQKTTNGSRSTQMGGTDGVKNASRFSIPVSLEASENGSSKQYDTTTTDIINKINALVAYTKEKTAMTGGGGNNLRGASTRGQLNMKGGTPDLIAKGIYDDTEFKEMLSKLTVPTTEEVKAKQAELVEDYKKAAANHKDMTKKVDELKDAMVDLYNKSHATPYILKGNMNVQDIIIDINNKLKTDFDIPIENIAELVQMLNSQSAAVDNKLSTIKTEITAGIARKNQQTVLLVSAYRNQTTELNRLEQILKEIQTATSSLADESKAPDLELKSEPESASSADLISIPIYAPDGTAKTNVFTGSLLINSTKKQQPMEENGTTYKSLLYDSNGEPHVNAVTGELTAHVAKNTQPMDENNKSYLPIEYYDDDDGDPIVTDDGNYIVRAKGGGRRRASTYGGHRATSNHSSSRRNK